MAKAKGENENATSGICSPLTPTFGSKPGGQAAGTYDHNPAPGFGKPRDMGPESQPEKIIDGTVDSHRATTTMSSPMTNIMGTRT